VESCEFKRNLKRCMIGQGTARSAVGNLATRR
jgi:hypothetical protein